MFGKWLLPQISLIPNTELKDGSIIKEWDSLCRRRRLRRLIVPARVSLVFREIYVPDYSIK